MEVLIILLYLIFGILSLILFFKVWGMTNDVDKILSLLQNEVKKKEFQDNKSDESLTENDTVFDATINVGDIIRLKINGTRYKVDNIDNGTYYCSDMVMGNLFKYKEFEIEKLKKDQE